ncbi:hypothetical protein V502_09689 [Pseudogymnoascus sp. VKM F-4520 (FW-2644)]|nr:hypothetical protein V502_09689 [Pseudogymnoascus sp. VKM F-4520 (FW-2644)]
MPTPPADDARASRIRTLPQKRISKACLRCRQRKSKCNLDGHGPAGTLPCQRCERDGAECILGGSNRGGRRIRRSRAVPDTTSPAQSNANETSPHAPNSEIYEQSYLGQTPSSSGYNNPQQHQQQQQQQHGINERLPSPSSNMAAAIEDTFVSTNLHNTSEALNFLSQAAENAAAAQMSEDSTAQNHQRVPYQDYTFQSDGGDMGHQLPGTQHTASINLIPYHLVTMQLLSQDQIIELVRRFATLYHPYLPITPKRSLNTAFLADTAQHEPHLLTAMITVAAKDLPGDTKIFEICSKYMNQLVGELSVGKRCDVEAVEALLLLAEWEPQSALSNVKEVGCGEEDLAAWMHVGLALRIGYYLRLDRTSFRNDDEERMVHYNRRRLAWAACYISDRQISVRIGRAFWSRGPGPVSGPGRHPTLQPESATDEDHASIFQAMLELTQLFGNVHDILYSGMGSSVKMMLVGNYVKYIDDFRAAINSWKSVWGTLTCSPNLKITLQMTYEYLRLYNSAYAFQATTFRTISSKNKETLGLEESALGNVGALPDVRFIYESIDAAKCLLTVVNNFSHPDTSLRHFPMRFSLYCVNAAVFLYKAWSLGVLGSQEKVGVRRMIKDSISRLRAGSVRPGEFGLRYAQLLELLWRQTDEEVAQRDGTTIPVTDPHPALMVQRPPINAPDEFSWLDLQAVGEFLTREPDPIDFNFSNNNVQQFAQASRRGSITWNDLSWPDDDLNRFF